MNWGGVSLSSEAVVGDTATITATYEGVVSDEPGVIDRKPVSVDFQVTVFDIVLSKDELELNTGENGSITANIYPESLSNVLPVTWEEPLMMDGVDFNVQDNTLMNINVNTDAIDDNNGILTASVEDYGQSCRLVILPNHEHDYEMAESIAPSCLGMGTTTYTCKTCDQNEEGHSYVVKEPQLEHVLSDGHFCDLCDQLIVPYRIGDKITRTVAGQTVTFVCIDEDYVDVAGNKGAYFYAQNMVRNVPYGGSTADATWANSNVRRVLNGTNSDKTHIMLTNTTISEHVSGAMTTNLPGLSHFTFTNINNGIKTEDYYFLPSVRELCAYNNYTGSYSGADGDGSYCEIADIEGKVLAYNLRSFSYSNSKKTYDACYFVYIDGNCTVTENDPNGWQAAYIVQRPACVIAQDIDAFGGETDDGKKYHEGDVVYQTVAGQKIKFVCIEEDYVDASGQDVGALFLSTEIIGANDSIFDKQSNVWATSDLRAYLNGANSVTDGLVQVNTTIKSQGLTNGMNWHGLYDHYFTLSEYNSVVETKDYFFALSLEEMLKHQKYMLSSDGQIRDMNRSWGDDKFGFYLRTPATDAADHVYYVYSDAKYYNMLNTLECYNTVIGSRPACVLPN